MPPTFGSCRVVELADEFKVSTADMLAICDRLGVVVEDASEWLAPETVVLIRNVVADGGRAAVVKPPAPAKPTKLQKVREPKRSESTALASVVRDGVRTRRVVLVGLLIALLAAGTGVLGDRWVEYVTATDAPATVVTTSEP